VGISHGTLQMHIIFWRHGFADQFNDEAGQH
jgi:hypothetical protein